MRVLLLSPLVKFTGNFSTIVRIKEELKRNQIECFLQCPLELEDRCSLEKVLEKLAIDLIIAVHLYKSGKLLAGIAKPCILVIGGTDVNELTSDEEKMVVMTNAVNNARNVVAFSDALAQKFKSCWPSYDQGNVSVIPQGVKVFPSEFSIKDYLQRHTDSSDLEEGKCGDGSSSGLKEGKCGDGSSSGLKEGKCSHGSSSDLEEGKCGDGSSSGLKEENGSSQKKDVVYGCDIDKFLTDMDAAKAKIFTCVGSVRQVKNPLFLMKTFSDWRLIKNRQDCWLLFIGANQGDEYFRRFEDEIYSCPGVLYIPGLPVENTHTVIRDSFALVNSSDSEGMALAILEAMALSTPVIVRNIPANAAIVTDGQTGFVYDTPESFIEKAEVLLGDPHIVDTLSQNAFKYVGQHHSTEYEESSYVALVKENIARE